jgi:hypothetical protein
MQIQLSFDFEIENSKSAEILAFKQNSQAISTTPPKLT